MTTKPEPIYTKANDPALFERYGSTFIRRKIEPFIRSTIKRIATMPQGKNCEYVEISQRSTKDSLIAFADFNDGTRMWIMQNDMDNPRFTSWKHEAFDGAPLPTQPDNTQDAST